MEWMARLIASLIAALVLGIERKKRQHTVGIRTLILISLSCTLLCMLGTHLAGALGDGDPTRVAAGVVTGIGFLGGGVIMRQGLNIRGLTSAAVIWTVAALGLSCGAGLYAPAAVVLIVSLLSLIALEHTEGHYSTEKTQTVSITYDTSHKSYAAEYPAAAHQEAADRNNSPHSPGQKTLEDMGYIIRDVNVETDIRESTLTIEYFVKSPNIVHPMLLIQRLAQEDGVLHIVLSDGC